MKTFGELKSFCEKNNVRYEISPIYSDEYYNPFSNEYHKTLLGWNFGMNNIAGRKGKSEWQWTWFEKFLVQKNWKRIPSSFSSTDTAC